MRKSMLRAPRCAATAVLAFVVCVAAAGCREDASGGLELAVPEDASAPADKAAPPDLAPPDILLGCPPGTRRCTPSGEPHCVPVSSCCNNNDCVAVGTTCMDNGRCECPPEQKVCNAACIPVERCCASVGCPIGACLVDGRCTPPTCSDGVTNGAETDRDCGGGSCGPCLPGRACSVGIDCRSNQCAGQRCVEPGFTARSYGGGLTPTWIESGDLDGDGVADVVTANVGSDNVTVLLGRGDGRLSAVGSFDAGPNPLFVVAGDLDGDGRPDLVTVNPVGYAVTVLLGVGDGTFRPGARYDVGAGASWAALGDLDGDGRPDIATANYTTGDVSVLLGSGQGAFLPRRDFPVDARPGALALVDLDADGRLDLVVAADGKLDVRLNRSAQGALSFGPLQSIGGSNDGPGLSLLAADFSGDHVPDVVVGEYGGAQAYLGQGKGGGLLLAGPVGTSLPLRAADLDDDGTLDLVTSKGVLSGLGLGVGVFGKGVPFGTFSAGRLALADLDRDGLLDLAFLPQQASGVAVARGVGGLAFEAVDLRTPGVRTDVTLTRPAAVQLADLNGDGRADLITASALGGALWVQLASPSGALLAASVYPACAQPIGLTTADLDEDGNRDVVVTCSLELPQLFRGSPSGQLSRSKLAPPAAFNAGQVIAADLDRDGHADLVFAEPLAAWVFFGRGDLTFRNDAPLVVAGTTAYTLQAVDFDGEGTLDLVAANGGPAFIALSKGATPGHHLGFQDFVAVPLQALAMAAWAGDLDGDHHADLVVADNQRGRLLVLHGDPGRGALAFQPPVAYALASPPMALVVADVDGDQLLDLAAASNVDRSVSVVLGQGGGTFGGLARYGVGVSPLVITAGDVNGDGKPDLATGDHTTVTVLLAR